MVGNDIATSADWVTSGTVGAKYRGVAVETGKVIGAAGVLLLVGSVKNVVGLVGSVHDITPDEGGANCNMSVSSLSMWPEVSLTSLAGGRLAIKTSGHESAATGSTKYVTNNVSALRVAVDYNVGAWALLVEGSDLRDTVAGTLSNLSAVVTTESDVELDVDEVARLALGSELAAGSLNEGEGTSIAVGRVVAASHEDDYISTWCVELCGSSLSGRKSGKGANGESLADGRHY